MRKLLRLAGIQARTSASAAMAYRVDFIGQALIELTWIVLLLLPLLIVYDGRSEVAGWDKPSAFVLMAYFIGIRGVLECVVSPSLIDMVERIRSGAFDYVLLKPVDAQAMVSVSQYSLWKLFDIIGAIVLLVYAFWLRGEPPSPLELAGGVVMFASGVVAMYSIWIICASAAFWVVRLDNLMYLLGAIFDAARWPVQVFAGVWRVVFTFVIPVALMTTYPAMAMLGRLELGIGIAVIAGSLGLLVISRLVWRKAIRSYTSASS
jgi:ABC-2 type transport system permease protein